MPILYTYGNSYLAASLAFNGFYTQQVAEQSHKERVASCRVGQFWPKYKPKWKTYSARNVVGLIFLHDVQIPVKSQQ